MTMISDEIEASKKLPPPRKIVILPMRGETEKIVIHYTETTRMA
jgi:hypothetical protein